MPCKIQPSKSLDFEYFLILNCQISDPHCMEGLFSVTTNFRKLKLSKLFFNFQSSLGESSSSVMSTSESQPEAGLIDRSKHLEHELQSLHDKIQQMTSDKVNIKLQWGSYYRTCPVFKWSKQVQFSKVSDFKYWTFFWYSET